MAKLLKEFIDIKDIDIIKEDVDINGKKDKVYKLKGPFLAAQVRNKNGRVYPQKVIENQVKFYNEEYINKKKSCGTLDHEETPNVSLDKVSHIIESLIMEKNVGIGCAKLIDTPMGKIAKTLVDEGILLGMSTRGVGSLTENNEVKDDFSLLSIDIVLSPSYSEAVTEAVIESSIEWIRSESGEWIKTGVVDNAVKNLKESIESNSIDSQLALRQLMQFVSDIQSKSKR